MNEYSHFSVAVEDVVSPETVVQNTDWRLLRRLALPRRLNNPGGGTVKHALVLDVETTGLSHDIDEVIQLAMLPFTYELDTGRILEIDHGRAFEGLREPRVPISDEAGLVTGLTKEMVAGKTIDPEMVDMLVADADLIIAHNASFDRGMVEKHWSCFGEKPWGCTLSSVDWLREGFSAGKLDYLGMQFGWFYDAHRALADCEACLALLAQELPQSGHRIMSAVRDAAMKEEYLIRAVDAPYDERLKLKERGYRWRPAELPLGKVWWTITSNPTAEIDWLRAEIYGGDANVPTHKVTALNRFSERLWEAQP
ncbi:3'-5' exonuclease [Roseobacter ponti]|uniref:3'-5' exonuclease n=1 Tax=Roseobacter ponti TaxID=1891787 RepID=A0A858SS04_9RHOB|nr:3'-5' exonuclease [Roseobacter ponti]QJF51100.1 3'-5' exonuclease [Roseobacter ponti]